MNFYRGEARTRASRGRRGPTEQRGFWQFALPIIGSILGGLGGKNAQSSQGDMMDPESQNYYRFMRQFSQGPYAGMLSQAMKAMGGDAGALSAMSGGSTGFMDPVFARQHDMAAQRSNEMASQYGGLGGTRSAVYNAILDRDINQNQAQFNWGAGQDALQRAMQMMQMAPQMFGMGAQPFGSTQTQQMHRNPWAGILGGGLSGFGLAQQLGMYGNKGTGGINLAGSP